MSNNNQNSRRDFIKTSALGATAVGMGVGFAAASDPVMAAAIETDFKGLKAGEQMIPVGSFQLPAYVSRPEKSKALCPSLLSLVRFLECTNTLLMSLGVLQS